jgi:tRNA pseudouridine13 synthase
MTRLPGLIKSQDNDFRVVEVPAFEPEGQGDHLYLWVEKEGLSTPRVLNQIARLCGLSTRDLGCAGRKDQAAVTQQWLSVPVTLGGALDNLPSDGVFERIGEFGRWRVIRRLHHPRRLKTGQLTGNRFELLVRGLSSSEAEKMVARCDLLSQEARLLNAYGQQRFVDPQAIEQARGLLERGRLRGRKDTFLISIAQAAVFNRYLSLRSELAEPIAGEWYGTLKGGRFDGARESHELIVERLESGEIVPLAPMIGRDVKPDQACGELIAQACDDLSLGGLDWSRFGKKVRGAWRPVWVEVPDLSCSQVDDGVELSFSLPSGSYATVLVDRLLENRWAFPFNE